MASACDLLNSPTRPKHSREVVDHAKKPEAAASAKASGTEPRDQRSLAADGLRLRRAKTERLLPVATLTNNKFFFAVGFLWFNAKPARLSNRCRQR